MQESERIESQQVALYILHTRRILVAQQIIRAAPSVRESAKWPRGAVAGAAALRGGHFVAPNSHKLIHSRSVVTHGRYRSTGLIHTEMRLSCCARCGATALAAAFVLVLLAITPSLTECPRLAPIQRLRESELTLERFLKDHLYPGVPVIIHLEADRSQLTADTLRTALLANMSNGGCVVGRLERDGKRDVPLDAALAGVSATHALLHSMESGGPLLRVLSGVLSRLRFGDSLYEPLPMVNLANEVEAAPWPPAMTSRVRRGVRRALLRLGAPTALVGAWLLLETALAPRYLSDTYLTHCPAALALLAHAHGEGSIFGTPPTASEGISIERDGLNATLDELWDHADVAANRATSTEWHEGPKIFWGAPGSWSYPTHLDHLDGDVFFRVLDGQKRFAIYRLEAMPHLRYMTFLPAHTAAYVFDAYLNAPADSTLAESIACAPAASDPPLGWAATLGPGEVLYMPGNLPHAVTNLGSGGTLNVQSRPWTAKRWRGRRRFGRVRLERQRQSEAADIVRSAAVKEKDRMEL